MMTRIISVTLHPQRPVIGIKLQSTASEGNWLKLKTYSTHMQ